MPGFSDYTAQAALNWESGQAAMPAIGSRFLALFTTAPNDSGSGGTEVTGGSYARVQVAGSAVTNATTASGNPTLHFASTPAWIVAGMTVTDTTTPSAISAGTTVLSVTGTTVVMSANAAGAGVGGTDTLQFSAFPAATAASGAEPATLPANVTNGAIAAFAAATASWGTVVAFGIYDASTAGNLITFDYLGNYKWLPFTCTSASPGVLTSPAHGYANGDPVVVTQKFGGTLPTTAGSWSGALTVASSSTDTFTAGVNTTSTGDGMVRKIVQQSIPNGVTASFAASSLTLTSA
jgi:hypothetical protein